MLPLQNGTDGDDRGKQLRQRLQARRRRGLLWLLLALAVGFWLFGPGALEQDTRAEISYTEFRQHLEADRVERITVQGEEIRGSLHQPVERIAEDGSSQRYEQFVTHLPSFGDEALLADLQERDVELRTEPAGDDSFWMVLFYLAPFLLLIFLGWIFFRRAQQQGQGILGMGKSRAKPFSKESVDTRFEDVAGVEGAKTELREIIQFLKEPARFQRLGGKVPRGVLLVGPPGTGKTLLARAVAGEADVPFFSVTGSDFMEMLVGVGASRVRDLFQEAKKSGRAIIFIDELDSIGRRRGAGLGGGHDEREQTLNQLLSEMDGFEPAQSVVVMAATNRPDILDPALQRPGRFDRRVTVDLPTQWSRLEILKIHARNKPLADDVDLEELARSTPGFSGADLENLLNEAALLAAREDKDRVESADIDRARDKILMGLEREGLVLTQEERDTLAWHEAGHAVLAAVLPHTDPIHKVSIVPRGRAMGVTQQLPEKEKYLYEKEYLMDRLVVMMGGRAAEELVFGRRTSGAEQDLKESTRLARKMVLDWGMAEELGPMAPGGRQDEVFLGEEIARRREYSESTARQVDRAVRELLDEAYEKALQTLARQRAGLDRLARALLEHEELEGDRVLEILGLDAEEATASRDGGQSGPAGVPEHDGGGPSSRRRAPMRSAAAEPIDRRTSER